MRVSTRLLLLIACCLLPTVGLQLWVSWSQWTERKAQLDSLAVQQAQLLAGAIEGIAENARILLSGAALTSQVRQAGPECGARLAALLRSAPGFAFIARTHPDGRIACASDLTPQAGSEGGDWLRRASVATEFGAGGFVRTASHPRGLLPFHLPLASTGTLPPDAAGRDQGGQDAIVGSLVAALDLTSLSGQLTRLKGAGSAFLANGVLTIYDAEGVILGRDLRPAEFVGQSLPAAAAPALRGGAPGALRLTSIDGNPRLVGYVPPSSGNHGLGAAVGFGEAELMSDVGRALRRGGILLGGVMLVVFTLTMMVARRFIAAPTRTLLEAARRWREGELDARAPECGRQSEFGQLALAFNDMAAAVQRREDELRHHAEALEVRVAERTRALSEANARLRIEIEERRCTEAALRQAQKMEAVGQLAGGIAHDFNNVLQAVAGGAALIRRRAADTAAVQRLAGMVEEAAQRGRSVTHRLLAFARRDELRADRLHMQGLLEGMREVLDAALGAGVSVRLDLAEDLPPVLADRGQMETVLVNLATNARDAMPRGGTLTLAAVTVRVRRGETEDAAALRPGTYVRLSVADTGEGMPLDVLEHATEPFFTTKPLGQGTGLGLAMARSFAEGSGGALEINSAPGQGTCVALWLPVAGLRSRHTEEGAQPGPEQAKDAVAATLTTGCVAPRARPPRVLLVDDEPMVREVLVEQLNDAGFAVTDAADAKTALDLIAKSRACAFDILVTDLAMPEIDGLELIREAQRRQAELPAILITGYAGDAGSLAMGGVTGTGARFTLMRKPLAGPVLADQIDMLLGEKVNAPPHLAVMSEFGTRSAGVA